jgi:thiosulfate:glutathione sulfurtransferase
MNNPIKIINTAELKELIDSNNSDHSLIDVREKDELEYGIIPTAKNIPLGELKLALQMSEENFKSEYSFNKPNKNQKIIFYCRTGIRAKNATLFALNQGFNAILYQESVQGWSKIDSNVKMYE